jgi:hypothetical protein
MVNVSPRTNIGCPTIRRQDFRVERATAPSWGEDEEEAEDEDESEDEDAQAERARGYVRAKCARCGEDVKIVPPKGVKLAAADAAEAEGEGVIQGKKLAWRCSACEARNTTRLTRHKLVRTTSEAATFFTTTYKRRLGIVDDDDDASDAANAFAEQYSWRRALESYPN